MTALIKDGDHGVWTKWILALLTSCDSGCQLSALSSCFLGAMPDVALWPLTPLLCRAIDGEELKERVNLLMDEVARDDMVGGRRAKRR